MKEYIERAAAEQVIAAIMPGMSTPDGAGANDEMVFAAQEMCADALSAVHRLPAAEVAEVRHGYWTPVKYNAHCSCGKSYGTYHFLCSVCNHVSYTQPYGLNYCPNCGARMDQEAALRREQDG